MKRRLGSSLVAVILLLGASLKGVESAFLHPKLKAKEVSVKRVVMVPPVVILSKQGVKGKEEMGKEEEEANSTLASGVAAALIHSGLAVESPFTEDYLKDNNEVRYAVADVQRKFDEIAPQLFKKPKDVRKGRFSLGDQVAVLNSKGNADALVVVRSQGVKETKGKSFMTGGLVGMALSGNATYRSHVALVDAKTGDILFLGDYISVGLPKDKVFEKSFRSISVGQ